MRLGFMAQQNEVRLAGARKTDKVMLQWALQYLEEYYAAMELTQSPSVPVVQGLTWTSPPNPSFKINVDGATFSELGVVGIGVVVRDAQGQVATMLSRKFNALLRAIEKEVKAMEVGMQFAKDTSIQVSFWKAIPCLYFML